MRAIAASSPRFRVFASLILVATLAIFAVCSVPLLAQETTAQETTAQDAALVRPLITAPVDESQLTVLKGNTHPLARREFDLGSAPASLPMQRMLLVLKRSPEQEHALRTLLDDQQDKGSPNFHKWLTPEQYGKQFGPSDADMQTITGWLQSHGFQLAAPSKGRTVIEFSGSASQVQEAFHTSIHKFVVNGEQHWANASDPRIPAALTAAVAGVKTLHNFLKKPMIHVAERSIPAKLIAGSRPQFTAGNGLHALVPEDYATIYNVTPLQNQLLPIDGTGTIIAVIGRSNLFAGGQDVSNFRNLFLGGAGVFNIILNGPDPGDLGGNEEAEATLDVSWSGALARFSLIDFVVSATTNTTDGADLSELYIIENNLADIMTESFGSCEANPNADAQGTSALAEQAAAQGITYTVATGDTGAAGCDNLGETVAQGPVSVSLTASTPFTVAVGGSMFNENGSDATYWNTTNDNSLGSAKHYIPEDVWNETCTTQCQPGQPPLAAGGGGVSVFFTKPAWQSGVNGIPADNKRDIPDVSLTAAGHDPYLLCIEGSCVPDAQGNISFAGISGTSASTPSFAGIMALVDQAMGAVLGTPAGFRQGLANYILYPLASAQQTTGAQCNASNTSTLPNTACVFNDVTSGNNSVPGEAGYPNGLYNSSAGYDLASGLGSVNVTNLVNAWSSATFRATTTTLGLSPTTSITHGQLVNVTLAVAHNSGTGTPTGNVSLLASVGGANGGASAVDMFTLSAAGTFSGTTRQLPGGGPYAVTAHYAGNSTTTSTGAFAPSDSNTVMVTVTSEPSSTAMAGAFTVDQFGRYTVPITTAPFGSPVFVPATVQGASGQGVPTGTVTFTASGGSIPNGSSSALNSQGTTSVQGNPFLLSGPTIPFDAGTYTISAAYVGDNSFAASGSLQNPNTAVRSVTFTIQPGFAGVSGPTDVTIKAPGLSGASTVGIITSTGFNTPVSFTCSGLPAEAACVSTPITGTGPNAIVSGTITVTTTGPHTVMLRPNERPYYFATIFGGALPLAGIFLLATPRRRRAGALLGLMILLALLVTVPACGGGGGGGGGHQQDPGTPTGTVTVTVTASANGAPSQQGTFFLTVQ